MKQMKDGSGGAYLVARADRETAAELARLACPIEQAAIALRRRNRVVYRMTVHDGDPELWFVSGLGRDVTAEQLVALAGKITEK
jgi:hypothetical protein